MNQKTKKGQPAMKNYVKYALTKLEENIVQDQLKFKQNKKLIINNSWCFATPLQSSFIYHFCPSKYIFCSALLNIENLVEQRCSQLPCVLLLINFYWVIFPLIVNFINRTDNDCCSWAEAFEKFSFIVALNDLIHHYLSFFNIILLVS